MVSGSSDRVCKLHRKLAEIGYSVRYVPLKTDVDLDVISERIEVL